MKKYTRNGVGSYTSGSIEICNQNNHDNGATGWLLTVNGEYVGEYPTMKKAKEEAEKY